MITHDERHIIVLSHCFNLVQRIFFTGNILIFLFSKQALCTLSYLPMCNTVLCIIFLLIDFSEERNLLSCVTFPCLQTFCQALGLEFQVVDMRWGVRDENISYHQTSDVCIQEIHNCQRLSLGPSFLVCLFICIL